MGLFLAISGVIGAAKEDVEAALAQFAVAGGGSLRRAARTANDPNTLALLEEGSNCSVLYPWGFSDWDDASRHLSTALNAPVFSLHIHDGDFWMFVLFAKGEQVAQFNPLPEYWDDNVSDEDRRIWAGDAEAVAALVPGLIAATVEPYFQRWDLRDRNPRKAFPGDRFGFLDCWQLCDFMAKLGLEYPIDDAGAILGDTYEFVAS
jgi:hypothetical protein